MADRPLNERFIEDLKIFKNDENLFKSFIFSFFNELYKSSIIKNSQRINIFSPFFDILSKSKFFGEIFYNLYSIWRYKKI